jgi:uroporphyrin-III C-methyltransferase/precorrin-2 dehydrogenase/sirohydrochlorin ferrochelatase
MHSLPVFLRLADRPVLLIGEGEAAQAKRRLIERAGGHVIGTEESAARIAFIALEDGAEADVIAARLKARGLLVNVVDRPDLCDFTMPAIVDRDPVIVAVGTGGASAGLAKAVRQRIERLLPPALGGLAAALGQARGRMRERWPDARTRRAALDDALGQGGALDPLHSGADAVAAWLAAPDAPRSSRTETVHLSSLDPDDLSLRAARLLGEADLVMHDAAVPAAILDRARADAVRCVRGEDEQAASRPGLTVILIITPS